MCFTQLECAIKGSTLFLAEGILSFITTSWLEKMHTLVSILQERIMNKRRLKLKQECSVNAISMNIALLANFWQTYKRNKVRKARRRPNKHLIGTYQ